MCIHLLHKAQSNTLSFHRFWLFEKKEKMQEERTKSSTTQQFNLQNVAIVNTRPKSSRQPSSSDLPSLDHSHSTLQSSSSLSVPSSSHSSTTNLPSLATNGTTVGSVSLDTSTPSPTEQSELFIDEAKEDHYILLPNHHDHNVSHFSLDMGGSLVKMVYYTLDLDEPSPEQCFVHFFTSSAAVV